MRKRIVRRFIFAIFSLSMVFTPVYATEDILDNKEPHMQVDFKLNEYEVSKDGKNLTLKWEPIEGANHYRILKKEGSKYIELSTLKDTIYTYSNNDTVLSGIYYFKIEAWDKDSWVGDGSPIVTSNELKVTVDKISSNVPVPKLKSWSTYRGIDLEWSAIKGTKYNIYRKLSTDKNFKIYRKNIASRKLTVPVSDKDANKKYSFVVTAIRNGEESDFSNIKTDSSVRTIYYGFTFKRDRTLTCHCSNHSETRTFKAGTKVKACDSFSKGYYSFWYDNHRWRVSRLSVKNQHVSDGDYNQRYTNAEAERYINKRAISSPTKYLIWVNLYGQRQYIFKWNNNRWKVYNVARISSGKPATPTYTGITRIKSKNPYYHNIKYWSFCNAFSIHPKPANADIGYGPRSKGSIRNFYKRSEWIYKNCKIGTTIAIH